MQCSEGGRKTKKKEFPRSQRKFRETVVLENLKREKEKNTQSCHIGAKTSGPSEEEERN